MDAGVQQVLRNQVGNAESPCSCAAPRSQTSYTELLYSAGDFGRNLLLSVTFSTCKSHSVVCWSVIDQNYVAFSCVIALWGRRWSRLPLLLDACRDPSCLFSSIFKQFKFVSACISRQILLKLWKYPCRGKYPCSCVDSWILRERGQILVITS